MHEEYVLSLRRGGRTEAEGELLRQMGEEAERMARALKEAQIVAKERVSNLRLAEQEAAALVLRKKEEAERVRQKAEEERRRAESELLRKQEEMQRAQDAFTFALRDMERAQRAREEVEDRCRVSVERAEAEAKRRTEEAERDCREARTRAEQQEIETRLERNLCAFLQAQPLPKTNISPTFSLLCSSTEKPKILLRECPQRSKREESERS